MKSKYSHFEYEAQNIHEHFPELKYTKDQSGQACVTGDIVLTDQQGAIVDRYSVQILSSDDYPRNFPLVFEIGGRIPRNVDWHIFPESGRCCICTLPEEMLLCKKGITLISFIENQVRPYFFAQKFREMEGYFLNERSHGNQGIVEFFEEIFKTKDLNTIIRGLIFIKQRKEPTRRDSCFCGSGIKYRKCHREAFRHLSEFTDIELEKFARIAIEYSVLTEN